MDDSIYRTVIFYAVCALLLVIAVRLIARHFRTFLKLVLRGGAACAAIYGMNYLAAVTAQSALSVTLNPLSVLMIGGLGLPGLCTVLLAKTII